MGNKTALFARKQSGGIFTINDESQTTGNIFFVNSATGTDSVGYGVSPDAPFASINYGISLCTAGKYDRLYAMPGHVETVATAGGLNANIAGVNVIGIGSGGNRPTINFTATASTMTVSGADSKFENLLFTGGINAVVSPVIVSAADVVIKNCEYRDVTGSCVKFLLTTAGANRLRVQNLRYRGATGAGSTTGITLVGGTEVTIDGLVMDGNFANSAIEVITTATTDLELLNSTFRLRNASAIALKDTITASTGIIGPNLIIRQNATANNITAAITGATFVVFDPVYVGDTVNKKAILIDWTATAST